MAATALTIADALASALNGHVFSAPYDSTVGAVRSYTPRYTFEELATLRVTVIPPVDLSLALASRAQVEGDFTLGIAVQQKPGELTTAALDALVLLCEEIALFVVDLDLGDAHGFAVEFAPLYDPAILREDRTFSGVMLATFKQVLEL